MADFVEFTFQSYVRGYHDYMHIWDPFVGQDLLLRREPNNSHDIHAVAVVLDDQIVGHVPYNIAPTVSAFLNRSTNQGFAVVTGMKVNRGAGYGLEIPCTYRFCGTKAYVNKMQEIIDIEID